MCPTWPGCCEYGPSANGTHVSKHLNRAFARSRRTGRLGLKPDSSLRNWRFQSMLDDGDERYPGREATVGSGPCSSARRVGSGVLFLSIGTLGVQAMSAVGQFVLAVWLQPIEYGYWATATSVLAILTGLVNLGEISGFLAGESASLSQASWSVLRINVVLALAGSLLAAAFLLRGNIIVGVLLLLASGNLVLLGESNLLYAAFVKSGQRRSLVTAQFVGAAIRLIVGVLVAWATSSAIAFALSMLAYTAVVVVILRIVYDRSGSSPALCPSKFLWRGRTAWAAQSASQMMAGQTDYLVISVVGGPALLGCVLLLLSGDGGAGRGPDGSAFEVHPERPGG